MCRPTLGRSAGRAGVVVVVVLTAVMLASDAQAFVPAPMSATSTASTHTVVAGDTLSAIAARTGVPASAIASANSLSPPYLLTIGMRLRIPRGAQGQAQAAGSKSKSSAKSSPKSATSSGNGRSAPAGRGGTLQPGRYVVREGDTVLGIARRAGVAPQAIIAANGLSAPAYMIRDGSSLIIPSGRGAVQTAGSTKSGDRAKVAGPGVRGGPVAGSGYRVRRGDTVIGLAARSGVSAAAIIAANGLAPPTYMIRDGQVLQIPRKGSVPAQQRAPKARAQVPGTPPGSGRHPSPGQVGAALDANARRYGLPPDLVKGVAWQESGWRQDVVSSVGAVGVMQLMPGTAGWISDNLVRRRIDSANYADNVEGGTAYLEYLLRQVGRDERLALASYYQGLGSVRKRGLLEESKRYVANVQAHRKKFR